jgi:hypothetical protein
MCTTATIGTLVERARVAKRRTVRKRIVCSVMVWRLKARGGVAVEARYVAW